MNVLRKIGLGTAAALGSVAAFAQVADPFSGAVADVSSKVTSYGGALAGLAAVGVVFMVGIKYIKKITRAS